MAAPGKLSRLSEEIAATANSMGPFKSDVIILTGTTSIQIVVPMFGGFVYDLNHILIPISGAVSIIGGGNFATTGSLPQNKFSEIMWSKSQQLWFPSLSA
jgi:hypothetical protein